MDFRFQLTVVDKTKDFYVIDGFCMNRTNAVQFLQMRKGKDGTGAREFLNNLPLEFTKTVFSFEKPSQYIGE
jgi:hypothetical protein